MVDKIIMVCEECGSDKVETKAWVSINTDEIGDSCSDGEDDDNWCNSCETHSGIITKQEYENGKET